MFVAKSIVILSPHMNGTNALFEFNGTTKVALVVPIKNYYFFM